MEPDDVRVVMLLADAAQEVGGKIYALGLGWQIAGPGAPSAIVVRLEHPAPGRPEHHSFQLRLFDQDGKAVAGPDGAAIVIDGNLNIGPPQFTELPAQTAIVVNISPLPLEPGGRFEWRFFLDEQTRDDWAVEFSTRSGRP